MLRPLAEAEERVATAVGALRQAEDAAAAVAAAATTEVESLSLEAAQARLRAQAEAGGSLRTSTRTEVRA